MRQLDFHFHRGKLLEHQHKQTPMKKIITLLLAIRYYCIPRKEQVIGVIRHDPDPLDVEVDAIAEPFDFTTGHLPVYRPHFREVQRYSVRLSNGATIKAMAGMHIVDVSSQLQKGVRVKLIHRVYSRDSTGSDEYEITGILVRESRVPVKKEKPVVFIDQPFESAPAL